MSVQSSPKKLSSTNTKQEMLDAYNKLVEQLEEQKNNEIKAPEKIEEKKTKAAVETANSLSSESIIKKTSDLKFELNSVLSGLSEKLDEEFSKYLSVKKAVSVKEDELKEIFEIQKQAQTLFALIEAQKEEKENFLNEMDELKADLESEIKEKRALWEKEKTAKEIESKEREKQETALRNREKEEYTYKFQRERQIARDEFETEKSNLEKELKLLRENAEKEFAERERKVIDNEVELKDLRAKTSAFPKELSMAIDKAVKEATEKIILESKHKEELLKSQFSGEKNALEIKISALEKTIKEQNDTILKYSSQLEKSYVQIQDIATKAVEGSASKLIHNYNVPNNTGM